MKKYFPVFKISFAQEFAYKANFIMWRVRNVLQIFLVFFLWDVIFSNPDRVAFGYTREKMLTYVFGLLIVKAFVLSAKAQEVAGEISDGSISAYLLKPINYFKYWLTRDMSSKALNLLFAAFETTLLFVILKPPFFLQTDLKMLLLFFVSVSVAMFIYFTILFIVSMIPFWKPEVGWGGHFLITFILVQFLSGALFPLDILPQTIQKIINFTPFPYLIFFPLKIYLGALSGELIARGMVISIVWVFLLYYLMKKMWEKGIKVYESHGQ